MKNSSFRIGCDIGGTFTDFVLIDDVNGSLSVYKCLTTPKNPSDAIETGIRNFKNRIVGFEKYLTEFVHGTTLVINAIIERKGAKTALITTRGFRDVLELGREFRYDSYDIFSEYPKPLVPRHLRMEVNERVTASGDILISLDAGQVRSIASELKNLKVKSVAISLINSYQNHIHEFQIKQILKEVNSDFYVSASFEVLPQIREYERTNTTVVNAYVKPITAKYLDELVDRLSLLGLKGDVYIMLSSGSITTVDVARAFPVRIIESGPTAAVIASQYYCKMFNIKNMFCFDMGGTTAKSCLIQNGEAGLVSTFEVGRVHRFKKGSGLPIQVPVVDLMEIGAGGGSIAYINEMGLLQVGPNSSGADPGPACYGLGGTDPTVTDADLILGYLNPDYFLGGEINLDINASRKAINEKIAKPLGLSVEKAAFGIHDLVNEMMATAAKTHIAEKGGNPNVVTISALGGAGPVHAYGLGRKIGALQIMIPMMAGVGSALGFFTAPIAFDVLRSYKIALKDADLFYIEKLFCELENQAKAMMQNSKFIEKVLFSRSIDIRFVGQGFETNLNISNKKMNDWKKAEIRILFDNKYKKLYGRTYSDTPLEFVTFKVRATLPVKSLKLPKNKVKKSLAFNNSKCCRKAFSVIHNKYVNFNVYNRKELPSKLEIVGPAILEERESTVVFDEDVTAIIDEFGFIWLRFITRK